MKFSRKKTKKVKKQLSKKNTVKKPVKDTKTKQVEFKSLRRGFLDFRYIKQWWVKKNAPSTQMFIEMELRTGKWDYFFIDIGDSSSFYFRGGQYIVDPDLKEYVSSLNMYSLRYHQDYSLPVQQKIPVKEIKHAIESSGTLDIENATNPITLRSFVISDVIKDVIQSAGIHTYLKTMQLLVIIAVITAILHFIVYLIKSGIFKELSGALGI